VADHTDNPSPVQAAAFAGLRRRMIDTQLAARGIRNAALLHAMGTVPRHRFVPADSRPRAYDDCALAAGEGQTISQPYIVALMTQALDPPPASRILEVGTGTGYQTAILAELAAQVHTIERLMSLADAAAKLLSGLGYSNVLFRTGDGSLGWPEAAPFDRILVTAAAPKPPAPLLEQLADGGRMVIPIGSRHHQDLVLIEKLGGRLTQTAFCPCVFVRLIGAAAFDDHD